MSKRLAAYSAAVSVAMLLPAASYGQNKKCQSHSGSSSTTSSRSPGFGGSTGKPQMPNMQISQGSFNTPTGMRRPGQPNVPLGQQQNPQLQSGMMLQHQQMQQGMLQEVHNQYMLQDQVKRQLLAYAIEAPTENLQRELKNSNAFVRWAASVELNRRWKSETSLAKAAVAREATVVAAATVAPARVRTNTPAVVTPVNQALFLQIGIPK